MKIIRVSTFEYGCINTEYSTTLSYFQLKAQHHQKDTKKKRYTDTFMYNKKNINITNNNAIQRKTVYKYTLESQDTHYEYQYLTLEQELALITEFTFLFKPVFQCYKLYKQERMNQSKAFRQNDSGKEKSLFVVSEELIQSRQLKREALSDSVIGVNALNHKVIDEINLVFICREDIETGILHSHIPQLIKNRGIKLVALRKGAEKMIGEIMLIGKVSVLSFKVSGLFLRIFNLSKRNLIDSKGLLKYVKE